MVYHGFWLVYMVLLVENTTKLCPCPTIQSRPRDIDDEDEHQDSDGEDDGQDSDGDHDDSDGDKNGASANIGRLVSVRRGRFNKFWLAPILFEDSFYFQFGKEDKESL